MGDLHIRYRNEGTSMPLIIPVSVLINTPPETLFSHIRQNSKNCPRWIKQEPAHDGTALLCGSGPSLRHDLLDIHTKQAQGARVFALNAAAKYLNDRGIYPDFQVMIDAKDESRSLIGPAKQHLFGATVHPGCFAEKPDATLFQLQVDDDDLQADIDALAPHEYSMMSTAVSVGLVSTILAFVMGYRNLEFYGFDSSHDNNESHVVRQAMNDIVACMNVSFCGKDYVSSLPMKLQAERFMQIANLLKGEGCKLTMHGTGLLPDMYQAPDEKLSEKEKYLRMWSMLSYRQDSPAERIVDTILEQLRPTGRIIDFGCGTGRAGARIAAKGHDVVLVDFASNCRDEEAVGLPFVELDLAEPMPLREQFGYCIDVMEHIPPEQVDSVLQNIMGAAVRVFFQISTVDDKMGALIGRPLHLSVHPHEWWRRKFYDLGYFVKWQKKDDICSSFLLTRSPLNRKENAA